MKNKMILSSIIIPITSFVLSSCFWDDGLKELEAKFGSIQLLLDSSKSYNHHFLNSNEYSERNNSYSTCYDSEGVMYNLLYGLEYEKISDNSSSRSLDCFIRYTIPFDDVAYIHLTNNGYGYIYIAPDLSPALHVFFKTNQESTDVIFEVANNMLASFIEAKKY